MIREITEEEAYELGKGATEFPVLVKEESNLLESAVCLKKFPSGYVLGISCDARALFKLYFSDDYESLLEKCMYHQKIMKERGHPFDDMD